MCRRGARDDGDITVCVSKGFPPMFWLCGCTYELRVFILLEELSAGKSRVSAPAAFLAPPNMGGWVQLQSISPSEEMLDGNRTSQTTLSDAQPSSWRSSLQILSVNVRRRPGEGGNGAPAISNVFTLLQRELSPQYPHKQFTVNNCLILCSVSSVAHGPVNNRGE